VWSLRQIALPPGGSSHNAKTAALNLLTKRRATLAFLEAHHRDLRHAIRLAGPNEHNAQEAWHRVFRDAERAVLRKTATAFRELDVFPAKARQFVLWHRKGKFRGVTLPAASSWFGDQDGLYAVACHQYRASMNAVAEWAKQEGLMDHAGAECIPESVSLLRAMMDGRDDHLRRFQRRDGYSECAPAKNEPVFALLRGISIFDVLTNAEVALLALSARPIELGPVERIIVQGRKGTSLFVVADGTLEVMVRQKDGFDLPLCILERGAVFGEMSLLTGERRSATVRSVDAALIWEVGQQQLAPILRARPAAVTELAAVMERRFRETAVASRRYETKKRGSLARRMREFLLAPAAPAAIPQ
jgi:CRP-like cAMP-binding protein